MFNLQHIYRRVRSYGDGSVTTAIVQALGTADQSAVRLIGLSLLERFDAEGCVALIEQLHRFPEDLQQKIIARGDQFGDALSRVIRSVAGHGRLNAARVIVEGRVVRSSGILVELLTDPRQEVVDRAAVGLLDVAKFVANTRSPEGSDGTTRNRDHVGRSVYEAVRRYDRHRRKEVLLGLCSLIHVGVLQPVCLGACRSKVAVGDLRRMLSCADEVEVRRVLVPLSGMPLFRDAVREGLLAAGSRQEWSPVVSRAHLLLDPKSRRVFADVPDPHMLWPGAQAVTGMDPEAQRGVIWWSMALPLLRSRRVEKLTQLTGAPDPLARLTALRRLMCEQHDAGFDAVVKFCDDPDYRIARIAARHLVRHHRHDLPALAATLVNSKHEQVSRIAGEYLGQTGFAKLWNGWPKLTHSQRVLIGKALVKIDPRFHQHLSQKLGAQDPHEVLRAMAIVRLMGQGEWFETTLARLCEHEDTRVASSAVRTLASGKDRATIVTIRGALESKDSRVRANAIEAIHERGVSIEQDRLDRMVKQEANRPRANAIAVLLKHNPQAAVDALDHMLRDPDPMQRRSALWLAGVAGVTDVSAVIAEMAVSDPDGQVREKAVDVTRRMIGLLDPEHTDVMAV